MAGNKQFNRLINAMLKVTLRHGCVNSVPGVSSLYSEPENLSLRRLPNLIPRSSRALSAV